MLGAPSSRTRLEEPQVSAEARKHARQLLLKEYRGVLSTHSQAMPGFPFGSVVPYCLDANGWPLILCFCCFRWPSCMC